MNMHARILGLTSIFLLSANASSALAQTGPIIAHSEQGRHVISFTEADGTPHVFTVDDSFESTPSGSNGGNCVADVDDGSYSGTPDDGVTVDDLLYYLYSFEMGLLSADVDDGYFTGTPDGGVTIEDLLFYLEHFEAGC